MRLADRIQRLVLIRPATTFHSMPQFYINLFMPKAVYLFFPWLPGQKRMMRHTVDWLHAGLPQESAWAPLFYQLLMHGTTRVQIFPRIFKAEELSKIKAPTLLILGEQEKIYSPEEAARNARALMLSIQVESIPRAYHVTALAQPERVNASLLQFFKTTASIENWGLALEASPAG